MEIEAGMLHPIKKETILRKVKHFAETQAMFFAEHPLSLCFRSFFLHYIFIHLRFI